MKHSTNEMGLTLTGTHVQSFLSSVRIQTAAIILLSTMRKGAV